MITYFTEDDLVSFGRYLLSEERRELFESNCILVSFEDRLKEVHHADVSNWMRKQEKS